MSDLYQLIQTGQHMKVRSRGYYPLLENVFFNMKYCDQDRGLNGAMPLEALHFF